MNNHIVQWNCRGLKANFNEILLLILQFSPAVLCLQETFLKDSDNITFKGYSLYNYINTNLDKACGGSSILVRNDLPHSVLNLNSPLQTVAVTVSLHKQITFCSTYIPPNSNLSVSDLESLTKQLPEPFILLGDLNGHSELWGCNDTNPKGAVIEKFIDDNNLCIFNTNKHTYLHPASGHYSALDLSICTPDLFLDFDWDVLDDQHGSDHFPTILKRNSDESTSTPKYKFNKADWENFQNLCVEELNSDNFENITHPVDRFTTLLSFIADECIPKTKGKAHKSRPWFNDDCKKAVRIRRAAVKKFNSRPTAENLENVKIARAKARRTIRQAKKVSWRNYVSKLNSRSSIKKVWQMVRKISGKNNYSNVVHLKKSDGSEAQSKQDIADTLASNFSHNSSSEHYTDKFQDIKQSKESKNINFKSQNNEDYNKPFSMSELLDSLHKANDTAAGADDIHYQFLKHLPETSLSLLLKIFNNIWQSGEFPDSWREAIIIPLPKPGKDATNPSNYRPIALTSCLCKTLERMINSRLIWYLESNNLFTDTQCGFRKNKSTTDHLVRLETFIRDAFIKKQHAVAIFFDLEKAYDTTWKYGIKKDLFDLGLRGHLPTFISNFLSDRSFRVRVGSVLSEEQEQEEGVPQGSILSTTLFNIKINNIVTAVRDGIDNSLFVDDFAICYKSTNMRTIERQLQQTLNKVEEWATANGFKFSQSKTQCVHFCQKRKVHADPELFLYGKTIPVSDEAKFLGLTFDKKLSFIPHIKNLKSKCLKALNLLKVLSSTDWGADRSVLLHLYRSLIRSKLDYGSVVYGSARKSYLHVLDTIHNQGLRLALGAFRSSPVESLYVEANEPSLHLRREKLSLQYALRLSSNSNNPAHDCTFNPKHEVLYDKKPRIIKPFGLRVKPALIENKIECTHIHQNSIPITPPWTLNEPTVNLELSKLKKSETPPELYKAMLGEIKQNYPHYVHVYTDGSKVGDTVGCAAVSKFHSSKLRLPDRSSIFTAEVKALDLALNFVSSLNRTKFLIFSDSLSTLQALKNRNIEHPLIQRLLEKLNTLLNSKSIIFCWIPSHIGISGNEEADKAAKDSLQCNSSKIKIPSSDLKPSIKTYIFSKWQSLWKTLPFNKLRDIQPKIGTWCKGNRKIRREEVVLSRLRIGHTRYTHSFLMKREEPPKCIPCNDIITVKHILIDCVDLASIRTKYFNQPTLKDLFTNVDVDCILNFIKEVGIYHVI